MADESKPFKLLPVSDGKSEKLHSDTSFAAG